MTSSSAVFWARPDRGGKLPLVVALAAYDGDALMMSFRSVALPPLAVR